jgi:hypothetical protein
MEYTNVKNPVWTSEQNDSILCDVLFTDQTEYSSFVASPTDNTTYGPQIYNQCVAGDWGTIAPYIAPIPTASQNKATATNLLTQTDWTTIPDVADSAISNPYLINASAFASYRSLVRQIAVNPTAGNLNWPTKPQEQWSS